MSFTHEDFLQLPTDILNTLPFGISLQNPDRMVLFENQKMRDWFGPHTGKKCYQRWQYLDQLKECPDCPGHVSRIDGEQHFIVRETTDKEGNEVKLKITHFPVTTIAGELIHYVEIVEPIKDDKIKLLNNIDYETWINKTYFSIVSIDSVHNSSAYISEDIPFLPDDKGSYFVKLAQLWSHIITPTSGWQSGLFGPLPLLDNVDYLSYIFIFQIEEEYNMLMIMVHREFKQFEEKSEQFEQLLETKTDNIFGSNAFSDIRQGMYEIFE